MKMTDIKIGDIVAIGSTQRDDNWVRKCHPVIQARVIATGLAVKTGDYDYKVDPKDPDGPRIRVDKTRKSGVRVEILALYNDKGNKVSSKPEREYSWGKPEFSYEQKVKVPQPGVTYYRNELDPTSVGKKVLIENRYVLRSWDDQAEIHLDFKAETSDKNSEAQAMASRWMMVQEALAAADIKLTVPKASAGYGGPHKTCSSEMSLSIDTMEKIAEAIGATTKETITS